MKNLHPALATCFALLAVFAAALPIALRAEPFFVGVGDLAGGAFDGAANAVSADGSVVVGVSASANGDEAFRWTPQAGIEGLGDLPGGIFLSVAHGVSSDGSVIAGSSVDGDDESRAFRWTQSGGMVALGQFFCSGCPPHAYAFGISGDGQVVVGAGDRKPLFGDHRLEAARWRNGGTSIDGLGVLLGAEVGSGASGASHDGSVIVGDSDSGAGNQGFRWSAGAMTALGGIAGAKLASTAVAISADGATIVGAANTSATSTGRLEAVRWTGPGFGTIELLGRLPGVSVPRSRAKATAGDGSIIVGTANDESNYDAAFIWDAANGIRKLTDVLVEDYGLDTEIAGWTLTEARGISDVDVDGAFTVVGVGINPSGDPEGWVAFLPPAACNDGADNDGDGEIDFPDDPDCIRKSDRSETANCGDGIDNDKDGFTDHPDDAECSGAGDQSEEPDCADGVDNDGDGQVDHPADPGCRSAATLVEDPACDDGVDNEGDGEIDFPDDPECVAADDRSEVEDCDDGLDNDDDGLTDFPGDPDCEDPSDASEDPQCGDRIDNDGDLRTDYPEDHPDCLSRADAREQPQCGDGEDNDGDDLTDFPDDPECVGAAFPTEAPASVALGDLLVTDRTGRRLFKVDPLSGEQTSLSSSAQLASPEGVAVRPSGEIVVADPAGLARVVPQTGEQRLFSGPLDSFEGAQILQVAIDPGGDAIVLESGSITRITWSSSGMGTETTLLSLPAGELGLFIGFSLAREGSGDLLVGGIGSTGDGIFRIDPDTGAVSKVTPGYSFDVWTDLAVEADGTILAVGDSFNQGPGVFRIDPLSGVTTPLSTGGAWQNPTAVTVNGAGEIFVADAGSCDELGCSGGRISKVDPVSGNPTELSTGGWIESEMDLAVLHAFPPACSDGIDNDGDDLADFPSDPGCFAEGTVMEDPQCDDGIDNDFDGGIDWDGAGLGSPDPQCVGKPFRNLEFARAKSCGLGIELSLVLPALIWLRRRRWRAAPQPA